MYLNPVYLWGHWWIEWNFVFSGEKSRERPLMPSTACCVHMTSTIVVLNRRSEPKWLLSTSPWWESSLTPPTIWILLVYAHTQTQLTIAIFGGHSIQMWSSCWFLVLHSKRCDLNPICSGLSSHVCVTPVGLRSFWHARREKQAWRNRGWPWKCPTYQSVCCHGDCREPLQHTGTECTRLHGIHGKIFK